LVPHVDAGASRLRQRAVINFALARRQSSLQLSVGILVLLTPADYANFRLAVGVGVIIDDHFDIRIGEGRTFDLVALGLDTEFLVRLEPNRICESHETAIYVLSGQIEAWYGEELAGVGDLFYIPAGVPHMPANLTDSPASAIIARTDPNEQESVRLLPHLDARLTL
jgi:Cupin domain